MVTPFLSLGVHLCLTSELDKHTFSVWSRICCAVSLIITLVLVFTVFDSLKLSCFQTGARARAPYLLDPSLSWFSG